MADWDGAQNWDSANLWDGTDDTWSLDFDPTGLPPGEYTFTPIATDSVGNVRTGTPTTFLLGTTTVDPVEQDVPDYFVEISFDPDEWTDITQYVYDGNGITITRGRTVALDDVQPGECQFTIRDQERRFDPLNTVGPYYGLLRPRLPVRVSAQYPKITGDVEIRFTGYIESWPQIQVLGDSHVDIPVSAYDELSSLGRKGFTPANPWVLNASGGGAKLDNGNRLGGTKPTFTEARSSDRVALLLDAAGYVADASYVIPANGNSMLCGGVPQDNTLRDYLNRCTRTELGNFYADRENVLRWEPRRYGSVDSRQSTPRVVFADLPGYAPYSALELDPADTRQLRNRVQRGSEAVETLTAQDALAIRAVGEVFEDSQTDLLFADSTDASAQAYYLLSRYKTPQPRINQLTTNARRSSAVVFPFALTAELFDRVVVVRTPGGDGAPFLQVCVIEQIVESFSTMTYEASYVMSQPDLAPVFRLGDAARGTLDAGNVLAY